MVAPAPAILSLLLLLTGPPAAVEVYEDAKGDHYAVSIFGDASAEFAAVSVFGDSSSGGAAATVFGNARAPLPVAVNGSRTHGCKSVEFTCANTVASADVADACDGLALVLISTHHSQWRCGTQCTTAVMIVVAVYDHARACSKDDCNSVLLVGAAANNGQTELCSSSHLSARGGKGWF